MRAFKAESIGKGAIQSGVPIPSLRPGRLLVKTAAVALNPTDWKSLSRVDKSATGGVDYSGTVEEVGSDITKSWKRGDRIFGFAPGWNVHQLEDGTFGEYLLAKGDVQFKLPDHLTFEEGATLGLGIVTLAQGLYQALKLPLPDNPAKETFPILIYGGSTATGALAIQFAKLSGLEVITTCSPHNFDFVKSLGADKVFDYSSPNCGEQIRDYTDNKLFYVYDTISEHSSPKICSDALSTKTKPDGTKPEYCAILPPNITREDVQIHFTVAYTVSGEKFESFGLSLPANIPDFEFMRDFIPVAEKLLEAKKFRPHQVEVRPGGLDGIVGGLKDLEDGKVSGVKLVYRIGD